MKLSLVFKLMTSDAKPLQIIQVLVTHTVVREVVSVTAWFRAPLTDSVLSLVRTATEVSPLVSF